VDADDLDRWVGAMSGQRRTVHRVATVAVAVVSTVVCTGAPAHAAPADPASPNAVIAWNLHAETAIWAVAGQNPWVQSRSFAMVQGAVYDAVNAIAGRPYQPLLVTPRVRGAASTDAAVATAAHRVLTELFPEQRARLRTQYDEYLAGLPHGRSTRRGIAVGARAAAAMVAARRDDGAFGNQTWTVGTGPGQWRPAPPSFVGVDAWVGYMAPFVIPSPSAFRTSGPPALTSAAYARDLNEVTTLGAASSPIRTPDQTEAAIWWHDRRLGQWEINRQLAVHHRLTNLQTARLLAMVNVAVADANIACFNEKAAWHFWRPITAIQQAGTDDNPATDADPAWTPLLATSPNPEYASGHGCATAAAMGALASFFGRNDIPFSAHSTAAGTRRHFTSFSAALAEVVEARIWGGIHFRTSDLQGVRIGARVVAHLVSHHFRPAR
jgi:hypothetical protein